LSQIGQRRRDTGERHGELDERNAIAPGRSLHLF
jgi:hypothetical protein